MVRSYIWILAAFVLMGMSDGERRAEQVRIKEMMALSQVYNKQPSPVGNRRALRIQRNRYRNNLPPFFPKTIYREPQRPPQPNSYVRFYGGIPRG